MNTIIVVANRIQMFCNGIKLSINKLSNLFVVVPSTVKNILYGKSQNPAMGAIKKLCDGFDIKRGECFNTENLIICSRV